MQCHRSQPLVRVWYSALACSLVFLLIHDRAAAQLNVALGKPIVDGSGSWAGGVVGEGAPFNGGLFPASRAVDGIMYEADNAPESWWLGREQTLDEYFTLDLGDVYLVDQINLFNTHNRQYNDRGTEEFVIFGSLTVDAGNQLVDPFPVLSGSLIDTTFEEDITPEIFMAGDGLNVADVRYLQFQALSSIYGNGNVGLNEIEVYSSTFVTPNKAYGKAVIDGSGAYDAPDFASGQFPATAVTDGSVSDSDSSIWLGREGEAEEFFTLDLGESVSVQEILLRNTSNRGFADRGTMEFRIVASDQVDGSNQLVNPVEILTGKLPNTAGISPQLATVFTADNGLTNVDARYLRFETLGATFPNDNVGLNEIEVYDQVLHEPTPPPKENNIAFRKPVIDGSGSWDGGAAGEGAAFDGGGFPADRVTDGSLGDEHIDGGARSSYWLGRELTEEEYFTIDLGDVFTIEEIDLRNTHNKGYNDRGTDEFVIFGALDVDGNNQLVDPFPIVSGNLTDVSNQAPITADEFTVDNGLQVSDARYLQFMAITYHEGKSSAGLNEIEVYGHLAGGGLLGDFNGDGVLDTADADMLTAGVAAGANPAGLDVNNDSLVNATDLNVWVKDLKLTYFGDANLDGEFNSSDLVAVLASGAYEADVDSVWSTGDFNADGRTNSSDLVAALADGGYEAGPRAAVASVPEPASVMLLMMAAGGLWVRAHGRRR
jgi:hypothetical protein